MIQKDEEGDILGMLIGAMLYIVLIVFMILVPLSWAWAGLMTTDALGAAIGYGILLIIFIIITLWVIFFGWLLAVAGVSL